MTDAHARKANERIAQVQKRTRKRVCRACLRPTDLQFGAVHSELPCERCAVVPCFGAIIEESYFGSNAT